MAKKNDSDPLPYLQVDRSAKPKALRLASLLKVPYQHALGSLIEFWDAVGDPRKLEIAVAVALEGSEPSMVLSKAEVELEFELASAHKVDASIMAAIGLLEPVEGGLFRVRGMSRYFGLIGARIRARGLSSAAGKASAEARRKASGSAKPRTDSVRSTEPRTEPTTEPAPNRRRTLEDRGQRSEIINTIDLVDSAQIPLVADDPKAEPKERKRSPWEVLWEEDLALSRIAQIARNEGLKVDDEAFDFDAACLDPKPQLLNTLLKKVGDDLEREFGAGAEWSFTEKAEAIEAAWDAYLEGSFGAGVEPPYSLKAFASPNTSLPSYRRAKGNA